MKARRMSDDELYGFLEKVMVEKKLFLRRDLKRDDLAREAVTNRTYISRTLSARGLNFARFVNSFRVQYALELLASDRWRDASPEDIACMSGFSSADAMNRYIKKSTGSTGCAFRERVSGAQAGLKADGPI